MTVRPVTDADDAFLFALYAESRAQEMAQTGWSAEATRDFLKSQFALQKRGYATSYPGATYTILQVDGIDGGRLTVDRQSDCLRLIDLLIASEWQGRGLGTDILRALMHEAQGGKVPLRLSVAKGNPVQQLYARLGFRVTGDIGQYWAMEWMPDLGPREV
ncbi:hypothetical protein ATO11_13460 [Pseudaestuariivita atlantica]|uniref:N-acetyltransferase domain-containing protein n=1 Tax=Pseudaestuariivita atlantica TaxID=1317121 RepID=A0A0L1JN10_9RHOB|nr:hypothetical protein ATO11_13460 [Pseudaestuariivita atlantica]